MVIREACCSCGAMTPSNELCDVTGCDDLMCERCVDDVFDEMYGDDPGNGSCARCGCDLGPDDDVLCDQCDWEIALVGWDFTP